MRLRLVRELDGLPFCLPEGSRSTLDNEPGSNGSHAQVGDGGVLVSAPRLGGVSFYFFDDSRRLEVYFIGMNPKTVLFLLLSLWIVCMDGVDEGLAHSVRVRDIVGRESIGSGRGLGFLTLLALLCP